MSQGRIVVITGSLGTGKSTTASLVAKESDMDKSVHMRTDDFYHYLSKGAIPPFWFCQYHLTHFIRTRIMQRERYDHSRAFFGLPEEARRWRCRFFC